MVDNMGVFSSGPSRFLVVVLLLVLLGRQRWRGRLKPWPMPARMVDRWDSGGVGPVFLSWEEAISSKGLPSHLRGIRTGCVHRSVSESVKGRFHVS